jgi:hypothetical protein
MAKGKFAQSLAEMLSNSGLDMSDAARMARAKEQGFDYARASKQSDSPINKGVGYAMFVKSSDPFGVAEDLSRSYGKGKFVANANDSIDVKDIQKDIIKSMRGRGFNREYSATGAQFARESNPSDIVNSAQIWDNQDIANAIYEDVLQPRGIKSVKTNDGLIVFDTDGTVRSVDAEFDPAKKDSSNLLAGVSTLGAATASQDETSSRDKMEAQARREEYLRQIDALNAQDKSIRSPVSGMAIKASDIAGKYNRYRKEKLHPLVDAFLPVGELPEEFYRKLAYGDKVTLADRFKAGLGML